MRRRLCTPLVCSSTTTVTSRFYTVQVTASHVATPARRKSIASHHTQVYHVFKMQGQPIIRGANPPRRLGTSSAKSIAVEDTAFAFVPCDLVRLVNLISNMISAFKTTQDTSCLSMLRELQPFVTFFNAHKASQYSVVLLRIASTTKEGGSMKQDFLPTIIPSTTTKAISRARVDTKRWIRH